jgi:hypothetical protein
MSGEINQASLKLIQNRIDLDQITDKGDNPSAIVLIFRNDDRIVLTWRDQAEREACSKIAFLKTTSARLQTAGGTDYSIMRTMRLISCCCGVCLHACLLVSQAFDESPSHKSNSSQVAWQSEDCSRSSRYGLVTRRLCLPELSLGAESLESAVPLQYLE